MHYTGTGRYALVMLILPVLLFACGGQQSQQDERMATATREIGEAYIRQGDYTTALRELIKARDMNPEDPFVYNDLGLCYMAKKRMPDAIANFKKAVALKPSYTPARNNLGSAYLAVKEWDAAIAIFKEIAKDALYATPQYPLSNLGLAHFHKGDYDQALQYYKDALKLQPDFVNALFGVGRTYLSLNQGRLALRYLDRAVQIAPSAAEVHYYLAEAYLLTGQIAQARTSYETVIDLAPVDSNLAAKAKQRLEIIR
ncbi:MAG: tetratricopeptide repeat protein [Desulfatitalea sp.]|nr:tetratricopeptide repeat protein [Desulfatitalea sp.]NNK02217.1 tetratricopeptide repeat protein [Desulfatitalea sp.]